MVVIIAEKPSLARNIAAGIGQMQRRDGYLEGCGYFITWAFGHLFSLKDIEDYKSKDSREEKAKWTLEGLPFRPKQFQFELRKDNKTKGTYFLSIVGFIAFHKKPHNCLIVSYVGYYEVMFVSIKFIVRLLLADNPHLYR